MLRAELLSTWICLHDLSNVRKGKFRLGCEEHGQSPAVESIEEQKEIPSRGLHDHTAVRFVVVAVPQKRHQHQDNQADGQGDGRHPRLVAERAYEQAQVYFRGSIDNCQHWSVCVAAQNLGNILSLRVIYPLRKRQGVFS